MKLSLADPENEHLIQESLRSYQNKTTLMIAHRLSTVVDADKILVIDKGKIVEEGKHSDLIGNEGITKTLGRISKIRKLEDRRLNIWFLIL